MADITPIKIKYGTGATIVSSGTSAANMSRIGEPLWIEDRRTLVVRDASGVPKSPLPDFLYGHFSGTALSNATTGEFSNAYLLTQIDGGTFLSSSFKKVTIQSIIDQAIGGESSGQVRVEAAGTLNYLKDAIGFEVGSPLSKTNTSSLLTINIAAGTAGTAGKAGLNVSPIGLTISSGLIQGKYAGTTADDAGKGMASFSTSDFGVSSGHVSLNSTVIRTTGNFSMAGYLTVITPTSDMHVATKKYVDDKVTAFQNGYDWKDSTVTVSVTNISLSNPGTIISGVTMSPGDRLLVAGQTATSENGIYVWTGGATPLTRATDFSPTDSNSAKVLLGSVIPVLDGEHNYGDGTIPLGPRLWICSTSTYNSNYEFIRQGPDLQVAATDPTINIGEAESINDSTYTYSVKANLAYGLEAASNGAGDTGIRVKPKASGGLAVDSGGVYISVVDGGTW